MFVRILSQGKLATKQFSNNYGVDRWLAPDGAAEMLREFLENLPLMKRQNVSDDKLESFNGDRRT